MKQMDATILRNHEDTKEVFGRQYEFIKKGQAVVDRFFSFSQHTLDHGTDEEVDQLLTDGYDLWSDELMKDLEFLIDWISKDGPGWSDTKAELASLHAQAAYIRQCLEFSDED